MEPETLPHGPGSKPLVVYCRQCRRKLLVRASDAGHIGRCAACGSEVAIPWLSETRPPGTPASAAVGSQPASGRMVLLEWIGSRAGLIIGGVVVGLVLLGMVGVFGYMLLLQGHPARATDAPSAEAPEARQAERPPEPRGPARGITFHNKGSRPLKLRLEHVSSGTGIERVLKPREEVTLGLRPGAYEAFFDDAAAGRIEVRRPETWTFTDAEGTPNAPGGWQRTVR